MLVQFTVRNYKTFKGEAKISLVASADTTREEENVIAVPAFNLRLLKSAVIYGANASGKSRFLEAMGFMRRFIMNSSKDKQINEPIEVDPFRLNTASVNEPSFFEIIFIHENEMFRYGFEVTTKEVVGEWLYHRTSTKEVELFYRENGQFEYVNDRKFRIGSRLVKDGMVRPNALLLSVAAQFNDEVAAKALEWLKTFNVISGLDESDYKEIMLLAADLPGIKERIVRMLKDADLMIEDLEYKLKPSLKKTVNGTKQQTGDDEDEKVSFWTDIITRRRLFDKDNRQVGFAEFSIFRDESAGTGKYFYLIGPMLAALDGGLPLIVDELDSKIHPNLVCKIIGLFNSATTNRNNAQLVFNTHDTNLLGSDLFRRDQIWFTEKNRYGAAKLFSLAEFKTDVVRKNDNFEDKYLQGKYGAVPYLGDFSKLFEEPQPASAQ